MKRTVNFSNSISIVIALIIIALCSLFITACTESEEGVPAVLETETANGQELTGGGEKISSGYVTTMSDSSKLIQPTDLIYLGAFRLPDVAGGASDSLGWEYGGGALTYRPTGDSSGKNDGFHGSLYGAGFEPMKLVSEITIPEPVVSPSKNPEDLNTAVTLQGFADVGGGYFDTFVEMPRIGLSYLKSPETGEKIHLSMGQHHQDEVVPTHAWFDLDLSFPNTTGAWFIGSQSLYSVNDYLFEIPKAWADRYAGGRYLATGRYRDGGWSGKGPTLFAYSPLLSGNPPKNGERLNEVPLLLYSATRTDSPDTTDSYLNGYQHPDEWEGGAWLTTTDSRSAVIFVGTKGTGDHYWYGWINPANPTKPCVFLEITESETCFNADGTPCSPGVKKECSGHNEDRGWWSSDYSAQMLFYDPSVFAAVATGELAPHQPQPYIVLDIDKYLFLPNPPADPNISGAGDQRKYRIGAVAYDDERGIIYVMERFADGVKPIIHVFGVR